MAGGGCGTCTASDNPTAIAYTDTSDFILGVSAARTMGGSWSQANFPNIPCPSPQNITWQWFSAGVWRTITTVSIGPRLVSGSGTQSANAFTVYNRSVTFVAVGTYRLRILMACGAAFRSPEKVQVVVAPSGKRVFLVD